MEYEFQFFTMSEVFKTCSDAEISLCVRTNCLDSLLVLVRFLDEFREYIESPIRINSSFRDTNHNKRVGGVTTSQHLLGQAIDFSTPKMPNNTTIQKLKEFIRMSPLSVSISQVIFYNTFIHIGLRTQGHKILCYYDKRTN